MKKNKPILFRASGVGALMVQPRTKAAREAGELSETAKAFVLETWLRNEYGYDEPVVTNHMLKGHLCEQDAIGVVSRQLPSDEFRAKNTETIRNEYFSGTPDVILNEITEDVKTSWTLKTFMSAKITKLYEAQLQVYMNLTGAKKGRLIYVLVNTPDELIVEEKKKFYYKFNCDEENPHYIECSMKTEWLHKMEDKIPEEKRIKVFELDYDPEFISELKSQVEKAREYYKELSL